MDFPSICESGGICLIGANISWRAGSTAFSKLIASALPCVAEIDENSAYVFGEVALLLCLRNIQKGVAIRTPWGNTVSLFDFSVILLRFVRFFARLAWECLLSLERSDGFRSDLQGSLSVILDLWWGFFLLSIV